AGIWLEAQAHDPQAVPGTTLEVTTTIVDRSHAPVALESARMEGMWKSDLATKAGPLPYNEPVKIEFKQPVPADQPYTQPYWLKKPPDHDLYTVDDQRLIGMPDTPAAARVRVTLQVGGASIELTAPVHYRYADRALGERTRPLAIVPAVAVNLSNTVDVFSE